MLGPDAEDEFERIVEVMGEDIEVGNILERLTEKIGNSELSEKILDDIEYWGIDRSGDKFSLGEFQFVSVEEAITFAQSRSETFFKYTPRKVLHDFLRSNGYSIQSITFGYVNISRKGEAENSLMNSEVPKFIKENFSPKIIRQYLDFLNL